MRYVLATAAYNEEKHIENLIQSVVAQTHPPVCWVIVSDSSTDHTDEIVQDYSSRHPSIVLRRITEDHPRNFVAQVHAINSAFNWLRTMDWEFIGNLDSDITLDPDYFQQLLARFERDPSLGLGGGSIYERDNGQFAYRRMNSPQSVAHAVQLFRRSCLEHIGGEYAVMPYGGPDWHAEMSARLHGWRVRSFPELKVYHHRPTGTAAGRLRTSYREGLMDHSLGSHPLFELFRVARRLGERPYLLGAAIRLWAFATATMTGRARPVSDDFVDFLRGYELSRLKDILWFR